ncbi:MAG: GNAT family N-acetyltransferase [Brumimicrobium sp.]|nr:GNAT family N-acetyltransferase [Brumimicrobium sp.]
MSDLILFRTILAEDNHVISRIIKTVLEEHGENKPGTVYTDPTTDSLFELFQQPGSCYYIAKHRDEMIGGCGIYPTEGLPDGYGELVKLYLKNEFRGKGLGQKLILKCFEAATEMGYTHLYLESIPALSQAVKLYEKLGFRKIDHRMGNSGHFSCNLWMIKEL